MNPLDLPHAALNEHLATRIEGYSGPLRVERWEAGQSNPTYLLETPSGRYVLRRKPPGRLLPSAHLIEREVEVLRALAATPIPVARVRYWCADPEVIGSAFYVMDYVPGRVAIDPALPECPQEQRGAYYGAAIDVLAGIHALDVEAIGLGAFGRRQGYVARQVRRWTEQYRAAETDRHAEVEELLAALTGWQAPEPERVQLVHGDYRFDNLRFAPNDPRVVAVCDWELATLGDGRADLGYFLMALRLPRNPILPGLAGLDRAALGLPTDAALVERYGAAGGSDPGRALGHYIALAAFRLAAIAQGVYRRSLDGNAAHSAARLAGSLVPGLARIGLEALHGAADH
jgi:aminoglycoside phosphotransferase (APT) family kinase protein